SELRLCEIVVGGDARLADGREISSPDPRRMLSCCWRISGPADSRIAPAPEDDFRDARLRPGDDPSRPARSSDDEDDSTLGVPTIGCYDPVGEHAEDTHESNLSCGAGRDCDRV